MVHHQILVITFLIMMSRILGFRLINSIAKHPSDARFFSVITDLNMIDKINKISSIDLESMSYLSIQDLYKRLGGTPGNMQKAELCVSCKELISKKISLSTQSSDENFDKLISDFSLDPNSTPILTNDNFDKSDTMKSNQNDIKFPMGTENIGGTYLPKNSFTKKVSTVIKRSIANEVQKFGHESPPNLESMSLTALQELYKSLGGSPGAKRKADLSQACRELLAKSKLNQSPTISSAEISPENVNQNSIINEVIPLELNTKTENNNICSKPESSMNSCIPSISEPNTFREESILTNNNDNNNIEKIAAATVEITPPPTYEANNLDYSQLPEIFDIPGNEILETSAVEVDNNVPNHPSNNNNNYGSNSKYNNNNKNYNNNRTYQPNKIRNLRPVLNDDDNTTFTSTNNNTASNNHNNNNYNSYVSNNNMGSEDGTSRSYNYSFPVGPLRDDRFKNMPTCDMDLTFLGTASCIPSPSRGVSCVALRYNSDVWLFDCGESTQIQMQSSKIKVSKIKKIFVSHTHGDHSFGIAGVLCFIGQATTDERGRAMVDGQPMEPIDIYGPEGIRDLVRAVIQLSYSRVVPPHRIHELKDVPALHSRFTRKIIPAFVKTKRHPHYNEVDGSRDIYPDANGHYHLLEEGDFTVRAAPMQHSTPCVGFVVTEKTKPGKLKISEVQHLVDRNGFALMKQLNIHDPRKALQHLKLLAPGSSFTFPDGTIVQADDILEPPKLGRKIVIMGDTCNGDSIASLAQGADVLIHESTNAWMKEYDIAKFPSYRFLERDTFLHGHSTPQMAGRFAKRIGAKQLILTHFSPRYRGEFFDAYMKVMWRLENMARDTSGLLGDNDVIAAWDRMQVSVLQPGGVTSTTTTTATTSNDKEKQSEVQSDKEIANGVPYDPLNLMY